jgi:hypothetical protein
MPLAKRLFLALPWLILVAFAVVALCKSQTYALKEAESQASLRLLAEFHIQYMHAQSMPYEHYSKSLRQVTERYPDQRPLHAYQRYCEAVEKKKGGGSRFRDEGPP